MPAAETACVPPGDPGDTGDGRNIASVYRLADRARRHSRHATHQPPVKPTADLSDDPDTRIAQQTEALFTSRGRTLTDDDTAEGLVITMEGVLGGLDGALATGVIDAAQHATLKALYEGMRNAPDAL